MYDELKGKEMVNRVMAQKALKAKRRGKHRLRSSQFINTGQGPKIGAMHALYGNNTGNTLVRNSVTGAISVKPDLATSWLQQKFPGKKYSDQDLFDRNVLAEMQGNPDLVVPLGKVKSLLHNMQELMQKTILENHFKYVNKPHHTVDIFFSPNKTCWMIVEMKNMISESFIRRSEIYSFKSLAIQALRLQAVEWVETVSFPYGFPTSISDP